MDEKQALVPRLRFPEFREVGEWANKSMGDLYGFHPTNSLSRDKLNYTNGDVKNIHYGDIHTKFATLFDVTNESVPFINDTESVERIRPESYCIEGDMIFADASEDMEDVGKCIEVVNTNNEKIVSGLHTILARQLTNRLAIGFGGFLFKTGAIREQIKREAQGAKVLGISSGRLSRINVCYPTDREEQQKIADCLSSLDALIVAQVDKIDALKTHKKGLMQQLFPREGETIPRLRFPEFREAGEWKQLPLGEIVSFMSGGTPSKDRADYWGGDIPWISAASMHEISIDRSDRNITQSAVDDGARIIPKGTLLILVRGSMLHKRIPIGITACEVAFNQDVKALRMKSDISEEFLLHLLISNEARLLSAVSGTGIGAGKLDTSELEEFLICLPEMKREQQLIVSCLSSLDTLIATHTEKLDALKTHKKGLMQQLFPAVEETQI